MKKYIDLVRVKHWIKNILIFVPLVFSSLINFPNVYCCILGFISFSLMASFIYIVNDLKDIEKDKMHPTKKNRPLPSGKIKTSKAIYIAVLILIFSIIINIIINNSILNNSLYFLLSYLIINLCYSFGLKNVAILDIVLLASGFVIRVYYGASLINVNVSNWLFLTILNASLFLGLGKRKKEFINTKNARTVLKEYNEEFLDKFQYLTLSLMIVFYSLWAIEQPNKLLIYTVPFIMIIFMRYCLIIEKSPEGDPTTILYQDKVLLSLSIIFGIFMVIIMVI